MEVRSGKNALVTAALRGRGFFCPRRSLSCRAPNVEVRLPEGPWFRLSRHSPNAGAARRRRASSAAAGCSPPSSCPTPRPGSPRREFRAAPRGSAVLVPAAGPPSAAPAAPRRATTTPTNPADHLAAGARPGGGREPRAAGLPGDRPSARRHLARHAGATAARAHALGRPRRSRRLERLPVPGHDRHGGEGQPLDRRTPHARAPRPRGAGAREGTWQRPTHRPARDSATRLDRQPVKSHTRQPVKSPAT
jgi:hypothetical protein